LPLGGVAAAAIVLAAVSSSWRKTPSLIMGAPHPAVVQAGQTAEPPKESGILASSVRGDVFVVRDEGHRVALAAGGRLAPGAVVSTTEGDALLVLRSSSKVAIEEASTASILDDGATERIELERGGVTSTVAKRGPGQRFIVRTPDAEVEVRGTVFRVSRLPSEQCGMETRVHVDEGRVVVRAAPGETTLDPGGDWASRCEAASAARTAPHAAAVPAREARAERDVPARPPSSELAAQNALFADAMTAKARGDTRSALASLDFLLQKYPQSPLREAAEGHRMMLVARVDQPRATLLAKDYLARYPAGFAHADAEKIARASQ
jgi:hypothetical protein